MDGLTTAQFLTLQRERARYGATVTPDELGVILNATAWTHRADPAQPLGMQRKDAGTHAVQPGTGIGIWNGLRFVREGKHYGVDCLGAASVGIATAVRGGEVGPADPASFVAPVEPLGRVPPPAPPATDPELEALRVANAALTATATAQQHTIADLTAQLADLQAHPPALVHPDYGATLQLAHDLDAAFERAQHAKKKVPLDAPTTAHLLWRFLIEGYAAAVLIADATDRGGG